MARANKMAASPGQTSLERLKALDSLPDLQSQLKEARQLCTHSARADMLAKWLLAKFQDDAYARASSEAWYLLDLIIRISPPERLATLLGSLDLIQTITKTVNEIDTYNSVIREVEMCLASLLALSDGPRSAAVKARLSTSAEKAATLLGAWLKAIVTVDFHRRWPERLDSCVDQVVQLWNLRKHDPHENEHFDSQCLVPTTALLCSLDSENASPTIKCKRKSDGGIHIDARSSLETLLAKHVFLSARSTLLANTAQKQQKSQPTASSISLSQRLSTVEAAITSGDLGSASVSRLLNIGLRSMPMQNSRQRSKEKPWIEALFSSLLDCLTHLDISDKQVALIVMLKSAQDNRTSLPKDTLLQLASQYGVGKDGMYDTSWDLLAQLIAIDATAFARVDKGGEHFDATQLFNLVSRADDSEEAHGFHIRDEVVVPIMRAFANNRGLPTFIDLWNAELAAAEPPSTVWLWLRDVFASLVENYLTPDYIVSWITRLRLSFEAAGPDADVKALKEGKLFAECTVVAAMLCGLWTSEYHDAVFDELNNLVNLIQPMTSSELEEIPDIWFLMRHVLELWFPAWAMRQTARAHIIERAGKLYQTSVQTAAQELLGRYAIHDTEADVPLLQARDMCYFTTVASHLLGNYDSRFTEACKSVMAKANQDSILAVALRGESAIPKKADVKRLIGNTLSHDNISEAGKRFSTLVDKSTGSAEQATSRSVIEAAAEHLGSRLTATEYSYVVTQFSRYCQSAKPAAQISMLQGLLDPSASLNSVSIVLTKAVLTSLRRDDFARSPPTDGMISPQSITSRLLAIAKQSTGLALVRGSLDCAALVLRTKPFLTNQCVVEATMTTLKSLAGQSDSRLRALYLDICGTFAALLQHHRSRLRDRMHLMVELLQTLLSCLFRRLSTSDGTSKRLTARHARLLARNLQLFCNPTRLTKTRYHTSELVDEARKAQAHVGQYMQYLLHHYCVEVLSGAPSEGVREALMPGLYAMIEAMEVGGGDAIKVLGAAMSNSERAVLRSVYDDYKSFAKWRGG